MGRGLRLAVNQFGHRMHHPATVHQINEQKATAIIGHVAYGAVDETCGSNIFAAEKPRHELGKAFAAKHHIYGYVFIAATKGSMSTRDLRAFE